MFSGTAGAAEATVLKEDYLNLRLVRLKASEQWARGAEGVAFIFPMAGSGQFLKGVAKQPLNSGDVLVLNGDTTARICCTRGAEFAFSGFSLRIDHLFPLFSGTEISLLQSIMDGFKGYKFYPSSSPLAEECHKLIGEVSPQFNLNHRGQCLRLAAAILSTEFMNAHGKRVGFVRPEDHLVQVFESLSTEEMLHLTVPELAERFGCSRRHLNRLFHQYFGFSVAALRMEMRLMKAVSLLRDSDAKVINVAEQCGFNHLGLFNTCFRRRFKTSPGQWRKSMAKQADGADHDHGNGTDCPLKLTGLCPRRDKPTSQDQPAEQAVSTTAEAPARSAARQDRKRQRQPAAPDPDADNGNENGKVEFGITVAASQKSPLSMGFQVNAQQ